MSDLQNTARARADLNKLLERYGKEMFELGYKVGKSGSRIVHCKECKFWDPYFRLHGERLKINGKEVNDCKKFENYHTDSGVRPEMAEDFYCAFGEKEE